ncbi:SDR family NAD(P)-dependent oxidoreductase [Spirillospora sp. NPDC047279]|uniref:SDR family NAD(P)-dependent oxidoreductase n=1 Tax=Spirillospora sp. NPDC047279 TaxID=3155478 RepID=UPI00340E3A4B
MSGQEVSLAGRVAIVTGAGAGLGRAEAIALAAAGARVVLNDLHGDAVRAVAEEIGAAGGEAAVLAGDIADWTTGEGLLKTALTEFGSLDIVVNNAGFTRDRMLFNMSEEEWDAVIRVHLKGHFVTSQQAAAYWRAKSKETGGPVYARVINTASEAYLLGAPGQPNYAAAKGGIAALTLSTAHACGRYGVRANAICPRARTAMTAGVFGPPPEDGPDPLSVDHVTPLVTYLASPAAERVTGQVFVAHGGTVQVMSQPVVAHEVSTEGLWTAAGLAEALGPKL